MKFIDEHNNDQQNRPNSVQWPNTSSSIVVVSITGIGCAIQSKLYGLSKSKRDFTKDILLLKETLEMFLQSQCHVYTRAYKTHVAYSLLYRVWWRNERKNFHIQFILNKKNESKENSGVFYQIEPSSIHSTRWDNETVHFSVAIVKVLWLVFNVRCSLAEVLEVS